MFLNPRSGRQGGFGLVELMIGLLVGMIIVAAALSLLTTTMSSSNDSIKMTRLDQELRQTMTMLTRDLRRATIWDPAADAFRVSAGTPLTLSGVSGSVTVSNGAGNLNAIGAKAVGGTLVYKKGSIAYRGSITAYVAGTKSYSVTIIGTAWPATAMVVDGVPAGSWSILRPESVLIGSATCILFATDTDFSGTYSGTEATNERFGYRYDGVQQAVELRTAAVSTDTCSSGGTWENLTDENTVQITNFTVTDDFPATLASSGFTVAVREYTISLTGQLKSDPSVVRTIRETVRVRNDRVS
jgi:type II secretory pathway component PulJ